MMLANESPEKVSRANRANSAAYRPALELITGFDINWNIVSYPSPAWAKLVFPNDAEDVAIAKLADAIFKASRVDQDDPIAAWKAHNANLKARWTWLNGKKFSALKYTGPAPTSPLASPMVIAGRAAPRKPRTASPAIPTSRPRKSSPPPSPAR